MNEPRTTRSIAVLSTVSAGFDFDFKFYLPNQPFTDRQDDVINGDVILINASG